MAAAAVVAAMAATTGYSPAEPAFRAVVSYQDCTEVTAVAPAAGLTTVVAIVSFTCDGTALDGREIGPSAVSEVVAHQPDGSFALLRTTTDNDELRRALARVGLPSVLADDISITASADTGLLAARTVEVDSGGRSFHIGAGTTSVPLEGISVLDADGLAHRYDGSRGTVTTSYENTLSGAGGAAGGGAGIIDAGGDDELASWLGTDLAGASVVAIDGSWTADVERQRRGRTR